MDRRNFSALIHRSLRPQARTTDEFGMEARPYFRRGSNADCLAIEEMLFGTWATSRKTGEIKKKNDCFDRCRYFRRDCTAVLAVFAARRKGAFPGRDESRVLFCYDFCCGRSAWPHSYDLWGHPTFLIAVIWRRRRDSNPRYALRAYNGLANRRLQPLGHVSVFRAMPEGFLLCKKPPAGGPVNAAAGFRTAPCGSSGRCDRRRIFRARRTA